MLKIINGFPYKPRLDDFVKRNCIRTKDLEAFKLLLNQAVAIAQPKAAYLLGSIQRRSDEKVQINGIWFSSRILRVNLKPVNRIFAYVCTAGQEIAAWAGELQDMLEKFWADEIQRDLLQFAERALLEDIQMQYDPGPLSSMSPGSLDDFPLDQQAPLFELLGDTQASVGVELHDNMLMTPAKTVSGILFASQERFESCQLCPREDCPSRRAAYEPDLYERKYAAGHT